MNRRTPFDRIRQYYERALSGFVQLRWPLSAVPDDLRRRDGLGCTELGRGVFPVVDAGQFRLRMRAQDGTHIAKSEALAKQVLAIVSDELSPENIQLTLGYVGMIPASFPVNAVYQWSRGPEEAILYVEISPKLHLSDEVMKERVRERLAKEMPDVRFSFEPSDIVNEVMSFGSPTPIEVVVSGSDFPKNREFAEEPAQGTCSNSCATRFTTWSIDGLSDRAGQCGS